MKKVILFSAGLFLILASCEQRSTSDGYESENDESAVTAVFTTTYEDLIEDKNELQNDLMELKQEKEIRAGQMTAEYDSLVNVVEEKIREMETKATGFRTASEDQKERLKGEFDLLENEASEHIDHIKDTFKKKD